MPCIVTFERVKSHLLGLQEKLYIFAEAQKQFRANQQTDLPADLDKQVGLGFLWSRPPQQQEACLLMVCRY